jgi:nitrite reductase/ring-hydroxylating ferredoxin subunit
VSGRAAPVPAVAPIPDGLLAPGSAAAAWRALLDLDGVAEPGALRRASVGDLDLLVAHTTAGLVAVDDRCPHMAAPLSLGSLDGTVVACPLHSGRFDLADGSCARWPTTGGLGPDGVEHPTWTPPGKDPKPDPPGIKAEARRLTRIRRIRYYPVRIVEGRIEVRVP